jgi:hypothetical protein
MLQLDVGHVLIGVGLARSSRRRAAGFFAQPPNNASSRAKAGIRRRMAGSPLEREEILTHVWRCKTEQLHSWDFGRI